MDNRDRTVTLTFPRAPYLVRRGYDEQLEVTLVATNQTDKLLEAVLTISPSPGLGLHTHQMPIRFDEVRQSQTLPIAIDIHPRVYDRDYILTVQVDGTPEIQHARIHVADIHSPDGIVVAVAPGEQDFMAQTLDRLGVDPFALTDEAIAEEGLNAFDVVVVGPRAYSTWPELADHTDALLAYIEQGGTLFVMPQDASVWRAELAPYPITLSADPAPRQHSLAPMDPDHHVFTNPNPVDGDDLSGLDLDEGTALPTDWDAAYTPLLGLDSAPSGALLVKPHGAGHYVYAALDWTNPFERLHPGALRLFVNILALGQDA